jgi:6,7-dimethyl-8-ribityllumazine synthase
MNSNHFTSLNGSDLRVAVVASRFNQELCDAMLNDAVAALRAAGLTEDRITTLRVPGSFELPVAASRLAGTDKYDAIVCLGVLIKGETKHDEYIASAVAQGLMDITVSTGIPVAFGVLTTNTKEQAEARALGSEKKGWEAAMSAIETVLALKA